MSSARLKEKSMSDDMPLSPNYTMPSLQVRKDHTCISIGLVGRDLMHMCNKCKFFQLRLDGISGRKPGKNVRSKCEKPWFISVNKNTPQRLIEKKRTFIKILHEYNYKVIDDECDNDNGSRLYNLNYITTWTNKVNSNLTDRPKDSNSVEPASTLKDNDGVMETQCESPSPTEAPTTINLDTYLANSYPRKYNRIENIRSSWLVGESKQENITRLYLQQIHYSVYCK